MYAQASVYTCSRVGRICRHRSQATSFDGRQLTRYSTQKILMLSPGDWATFFLHGGRVSSGVRSELFHSSRLWTLLEDAGAL